ncbi:MAG: hypothetical protein WBC44_08990 [Planctomycetaceae bacterium]
MNAQRTQRTGKTLIEMLVVMVGLTAVLVAAGQLFHRLSQAERLVRGSAAVGRSEMRLARDFREDVRAATSVEPIENEAGHGLRLVVSEGTIEYVAQAESVLRTTAGQSRQHREGYRLGTVTARFAVEGDRFAVLTIEPHRTVDRRDATAGPLQIVAAIGADRRDDTALPRETAPPPVEAPKPVEEGES